MLLFNSVQKKKWKNGGVGGSREERIQLHFWKSATIEVCVQYFNRSGQSWVSFKRAKFRQFLVLLHFYFSEDYSGQGFLVYLSYLQWLKQSPRDLRWLYKMWILYGKVTLNFQFYSKCKASVSFHSSNWYEFTVKKLYNTKMKNNESKTPPIASS